MNDKHEQLNRLIKSFSSIDDELMLDIEPAKINRVETRPLKLTLEESKVVEIKRVETKPSKKPSTHKKWVPLAVAAACLVFVIGFLFIWNNNQQMPKDLGPLAESEPKTNNNVGIEPLNTSTERKKEVEIPVGSLDGKFFADIVKDAQAVKVTERHEVSVIDPGDSDTVEVDLRQVLMLADKSAIDILSSTSGNALYSPVWLYESIFFLANSVEDDQSLSFRQLLGNIPETNSYGRYWKSLFSKNRPSVWGYGKNTLMIGEQVWNKSDRGDLVLLARESITDLYRWKSSANQKDQQDPSQSEELFGSSHLEVRWDSSKELLFMMPFDFNIRWTMNLSKVNHLEGTFHSGYKTINDVSYLDADDASLLHYAVDGGVVCELPVSGGYLYLILPDEGLTPEDLLKQDRFFTNLLNATPVGKHAVARFPVFQIRDERNLVGSKGFSDLRNLVVNPIRFKWLKDMDMTVPHLIQDINFRLDGPVRRADEHGPDATGRMTLEAVYDRPFIFCLTDSEKKTPTLIGVVRNPVK